MYKETMMVPNQDHFHMKFIRPFMILAGIWPLKLTGFKLFLYNVYFYFTFTYYVLNVATIYVTAKQIATGGTSTEITNYISNAVFSTLLIYKALIYRSCGVKELLEFIEASEKSIFLGADEEAKKIYRANVDSTTSLGRIYVYQGVITTFFAQLFPLISTLMSKPNEDGYKEKYYIVANWEPFDKYKYYYTAYFVQLLFTMCGEMYIVFCGTFFLFILEQLIGQLLVLQNQFGKMFENAQMLCRENEITFKEACNQLMKECIQKHQEVIALVAHVDKTFRRYILVDYMCTSFGLSLVVLQFLLEKTMQMKIAAAAYFFTFASQSLIIYYHADVVVLQGSYGLIQAILAGDWHELDISAQKMLPFVILRAQKPLTLSIGPFRKVGIESMISLFKATYSYLSVMWQ